jgi:hypothetical protein
VAGAALFGDYGDAHPDPTPFRLDDAPAPRGTPPAARPSSAPAVAAASAAAAATRATPPTHAAASTAKPAAAVETPAPLAPWDSPQGEFGAEIVAQLKRTPWFAAAIAVHVLVWVLFTLFRTHVPEQRQRLLGAGVIAGSTLPDEGRLEPGPSPDDGASSLDPVPIPLPAPESPAPTEDPTSAQDAPTMLSGVPTIEEQPTPDMGTLPSLSAAGRRTTARTRPRVPAKGGADLRETFDKSGSHDARKRAAKHVLDSIGVDRGGPGEALRTLSTEDVLVIEGAWDHQERVLDELKIPYKLMSPYDERIADGSAFKRPRFLFWNCGDKINERHIMRLAPRVRAFVERGGYLFTSDWALDNVLRPAFPGYVDTDGTKAPLPEMVIEIAPTRAGAKHPLLEGVFADGIAGKWWLERASHDIIVRKTTEVTVLVESPQLREIQARTSTMAFTFGFGKGRVLHILGHYDQEQGNLAGTIAAQRIALNFVMLGLKDEADRAEKSAGEPPK